MTQTIKTILDEAIENYQLGLISLNEFLEIQRKISTADAHLIAAAPELLEALELLKKQVIDFLIPSLQKAEAELWIADEISFHAVCHKVDEAIKKAKGE